MGATEPELNKTAPYVTWTKYNRVQLQLIGSKSSIKGCISNKIDTIMPVVTATGLYLMDG
jgi:hypothetical protein